MNNILRKPSDTPYNHEWFTKRAYSSLRRIDADTWDYSDSLLLYVSSGAQTYEALQDTDTAYFSLVTQPERECLAVAVGEIGAVLPDDFDYIDLGPGTDHKEQFFFDAFKSQGKTFTYTPVDISTYYLALAAKHARDQGIHVNPVNASFEELPSLLGPANRPRFVSIGITFANFAPEVILVLLQHIAGEGGYVHINVHMRDRVDLSVLQKTYITDGAHLADEKLKLIGLDPGCDTTPFEADHCVKVWCTVTRCSEGLKRRGVKNGDRLLTFQSLRYTRESLDSILSSHAKSYKVFDSGTPFVASLIQV